MILWDLDTSQIRMTTRSSSVPLAVTGDGTTIASAGFFATDGTNETVKLWDVATGQGRATFKGHAFGVCLAAFPEDGKTLVTVSRDGTVRRWTILLPN
jgi:WD40 repeat protein